jgi:carbonic anhydrase/acetyltransferase-like protein (isoleucine patch superfamily)
MPVYALGDQVPDIHPSAYVHPEAVVIGSVWIGAQSSVWPGAVLRGDDGEIRVGARTSIQDGAILHTTPFWPTTVGDECVIGHLAHLEGCTVEDGALVGSGSIVLHRAVISSESIVGAGAVVSGGTVVPSRAMALGVPAKIRPDTVDPDSIRLGMLSYVQRSERYAEELRRVDLPD